MSALGKHRYRGDYTDPARLTLVSYRRQLKKPPHPRQDEDHDGYPDCDPQYFYLCDTPYVCLLSIASAVEPARWSRSRRRLIALKRCVSSSSVSIFSSSRAIFAFGAWCRAAFRAPGRRRVWLFQPRNNPLPVKWRIASLPIFCLQGLMWIKTNENFTEEEVRQCLCILPTFGIRNFSGTAKRPIKTASTSCLALKWPLFHADGGASDQSESIAADRRITGFFGKKAASKKLCRGGGTLLLFAVTSTRSWSDEATGARSGVPKNNGLLSIANHLGMVISRSTISFTLN